MKINSYSCRTFFSALALVVFIVLGSAKFSAAQIDCNAVHDAPACNLDGPLTACLDGGNMIITTTVQVTGRNPVLVYSFPVNTSGAEIVDTNFVSYNSVDSTYIESVIVSPGVTSGSFNLELDVSVSYSD